MEERPAINLLTARSERLGDAVVEALFLDRSFREVSVALRTAQAYRSTYIVCYILLCLILPIALVVKALVFLWRIYRYIPLPGYMSEYRAYQIATMQIHPHRRITRGGFFTRFGWVFDWDSVKPHTRPLPVGNSASRIVVHRRSGVVYAVKYINWGPSQTWQASLRELEKYVRQQPPGTQNNKINYCLIVTCSPEETQAVCWNLKQALELPYLEFEPLFLNKVPGPIFRGAERTMLWLKDKLAAEGIRCEVRRLPWRKIVHLERFYLSYYQANLADAYDYSRNYQGSLLNFQHRWFGQL